jgi:hypothetical protein
MKKKLILLLLSPLIVLYFTIRLFWRSSERLQHGGGHDTIYPLLPYSSGGVRRKDFEDLYEKKKDGHVVTSNDYFNYLYGSEVRHSLMYIKIQKRKEIISYFYLF